MRSPKLTSFHGKEHSRVIDVMNISPIPGGMSWLLDSGGAKQSSSSSLVSSSDSNKTNYYSINNVKSSEKLRMTSSTGMMRVHSMQIPQTAYVNIEQPQPPMQQNDLVDILSQSVQSCTSAIFGLYGIEIWKFDKANGGLFSVPIKSSNVMDLRRHSSLFITRVTQEADYASPHFNSAARDAFERLTDTVRLDHLSKKMTDPGVGVAGALWSEASTSTSAPGVESISSSIHRRVGLLAGVPSIYGHESDDANAVLWREVDTLAEDPDQPYDERLQCFAKAGFKLAAGIPFDIRGFMGIVVFYANPHADAQKLRHPENSQLILMAAQFIGSAVAMQNPMKKAKLRKSRQPVENWKRLRVKILAVVRFHRPLYVRRRRSNSSSPKMRRVESFNLAIRRVASFAMNRENSFKVLSQATTRLKRGIQKSVEDVQYTSKAKGMKWWSKVKGGHAKNPPAFNTLQCMWTFFGVWTTHSILTGVDYLIVNKSAGEYALLLGPLGALTTLQYNLTAAPASQPKNAFFSQVIALSTCLFLHQFQDLNQWHRSALAPAIVTTLTARLGLIHPPAGATAVLFSYNNFSPEIMIIFLGGVLFAIFTAVIINNLCDRRQYPSTSWVIF